MNTPQVLQIVFSTATHWRMNATFLHALTVAFPAARIGIESAPRLISVPEFFDHIATLKGGYHADRMSVVLRIPDSFSKFADFLETFVSIEPSLASSINVFCPSKAEQSIKNMSMNDLIPVLRMANAMLASSYTPAALIELQKAG